MCVRGLFSVERWFQFHEFERIANKTAKEWSNNFYWINPKRVTQFYVYKKDNNEIRAHTTTFTFSNSLNRSKSNWKSDLQIAMNENCNDEIALQQRQRHNIVLCVAWKSMNTCSMCKLCKPNYGTRTHFSASYMDKHALNLSSIECVYWNRQWIKDPRVMVVGVGMRYVSSVNPFNFNLISAKIQSQRQLERQRRRQRRHCLSIKFNNDNVNMI